MLPKDLSTHDHASRNYGQEGFQTARRAMGRPRQRNAKTEHYDNAVADYAEAIRLRQTRATYANE